MVTDAPEGLCPACLMEQGLEVPSSDEAQAPDPGAATTKAADPPQTPDERVIGPYLSLIHISEPTRPY